MSIRAFFLILSSLLLGCTCLAEGQASYLSFEPIYFVQKGLFEDQQQLSYSAAIKPFYTRSWEELRLTFDFAPFYRWDSIDEKRTHFDLRELSLVKASENWEIRLGIRKVFWGAVETRHLIDVINQTDWVEDIKSNEKLGQPMINPAWVTPKGTLDFYYLPYFRKRTFPGEKGRFRFPIPVDEASTQFESSQKEWHPDWALRWSSTKPFDYGISYFEGTNREPELRPALNSSGSPVLSPFYSQMKQASLDLQYTLKSWLFKFEGLNRKTSLEQFNAYVGGFEYTISTTSGIDWGLLAEYGHDDRESLSYWLKDYFFEGLRVSFNDLNSTEVLLGVTTDNQYGATLASLEAKRKLSEDFKASLETLNLLNVDSSHPFYGYRKDNYLKIKLDYYF